MHETCMKVIGWSNVPVFEKTGTAEGMNLLRITLQHGCELNNKLGLIHINKLCVLTKQQSKLSYPHQF